MSWLFFHYTVSIVRLSCHLGSCHSICNKKNWNSSLKLERNNTTYTNNPIFYFFWSQSYVCWKHGKHIHTSVVKKKKTKKKNQKFKVLVDTQVKSTSQVHRRHFMNLHSFSFVLISQLIILVRMELPPSNNSHTWQKYTTLTLL